MADFDEGYTFPYIDIEEEEFSDTQKDCVNDLQSLYSKYEILNLRTFDHTEHKLYETENYIDPENHFYNNTDNNCEYYTDDQFDCHVKMEGALSIIHFNSRSLCRNFRKIKDYLC